MVFRRATGREMQENERIFQSRCVKYLLEMQ